MKIMLRLSRIKISILIFAGILISAAFPISASAAEIAVNDFISLKNAVASASNWDSIVIGDSFDFTETLNVDKSLTFRSPNKVNLTVSGNFRHIYVMAYNGGDITLEFDNVALIGRKTLPDDTTSGGGINIIRTEDHPSTANISNTIGTLRLVNAVIQRCHNGGLAGSAYGGGIGFTWPQGQPVIDYCNLEISGSKTDISNNSANRGGGIAANHVTFNDGAVYGNTADVWAGGIYAYGGLTMNGGTISGNRAGSYGGGSANYHGDYIINDGTISGNEAGEAGGGIYTGYSLTMNGGNIEYNKTNGFGGGASAGTAGINGGKIIGNAAVKTGGGIACFEQLNMSLGEISGNSSDDNGGGIYTYYFEGYSKDAVITGGFVGGNTAVQGGGMYAEGGVSIAGAVFQGNTSSQNGGGLYSYSGTAAITDSTIIGNTAGLDGGGIWIDDLSRLTTNRVAFKDNKAQAGYVWDINNPSDEQQAADAVIHKANIIDTVYTTPFTNAYSNYDVNYDSGVLLGDYINNIVIIPDTGQNVTGAENYGTGRVYGTPNPSANFIGGENIEKIVTQEEAPIPKKHPDTESQHINPSTGYMDEYVLPFSLLLCMVAICIAAFNEKR